MSARCSHRYSKGDGKCEDCGAKVGARVAEYVWRVIAVDGEGYGLGDCGHAHVDQDEAAACDWAPPGWEEMPCCDLLVRQVRERSTEPPRKRRSKAA